MYAWCLGDVQTIYEKLSAKLHLLWGVEFEQDIIYRDIMDEQAKLHEELEVWRAYHRVRLPACRIDQVVAVDELSDKNWKTESRTPSYITHLTSLDIYFLVTQSRARVDGGYRFPPYGVRK